MLTLYHQLRGSQRPSTGVHIACQPREIRVNQELGFNPNPSSNPHPHPHPTRTPGAQLACQARPDGKAGYALAKASQPSQCEVEAACIGLQATRHGVAGYAARVLQVAGLPVHEEEEEEGAGADDPEQVHDRLSTPEAHACEWPLPGDLPCPGFEPCATYEPRPARPLHEA